MSRLFHKMTRPRTAVLSAFDAALDYSNVIFCPPQKLPLLPRSLVERPPPLPLRSFPSLRTGGDKKTKR
jgi:hypothetical protein